MVLTYDCFTLQSQLPSHSTYNLQFSLTGGFLYYQVSHILVGNLFFQSSPETHETDYQNLRVKTECFHVIMKLYHSLSYYCRIIKYSLSALVYGYL